MKTKIQKSASRLTLHAAMLLLTLCPMPYALCQQVIYVDASNTTGIEDGSEQHPFNTIKEGIAAASAGTTVMIKAGTYYPDDYHFGQDNALFLKAGVMLKGENKNTTIIEGILVDENESNLPVGVEDLSFQTFSFVRGTHPGPFDEQTVVRNCSADMITIFHAAGIPVNDTTPGPIYGFLLEYNEAGGINFPQGSGVAENVIRNNQCGAIHIASGGGYTYIIDNNEIQYGIKDISGTNNTKICNNIIYNGPIIDRSGGNLFGIEDQIIENNIIYCDEDSPGLEGQPHKAAIIATPQSVTIRNNTITCTGNVSGIWASSGAPFNVNNNIITVDKITQPSPDPENAHVGIRTTSGRGSITGNKISGGYFGYYSKSGAEIFSDNEISEAYTGFFSSGAEEVRHNTISNCYGDGMIMYGLRGPVHNNVVKDNAGSGIRVAIPDIDLGGGNFGGPGNNIITGNGNYDLYIECQSSQYPVLYAKYNVWDHTDPNDIMLYDIRDGNDSTGLVTVDFMPFAYLEIEEHGGKEAGGHGSVEVWPNPTQGVVSLKSLVVSHQSAVGGQRSALVEILDIFGKPLETRNSEFGIRNPEFDISHLPTGIYFIRISLENQIIVKKIIKL